MRGIRFMRILHSTYLIELARQIKNQIAVVDISEECEKIEDRSQKVSIAEQVLSVDFDKKMFRFQNYSSLVDWWPIVGDPSMLIRNQMAKLKASKDSMLLT